MLSNNNSKRCKKLRIAIGILLAIILLTLIAGQNYFKVPTLEKTVVENASNNITPAPTPTLGEGELGYDDGEKDSKYSVGSSYKIGHLVRFTSPKDGFTINGVKMYGYRFGNGTDWYGLGRSFSLEVWNSDLKTIYTMSSDYDKYFDKGEENIKWVEISIPSVKVNNDFYIFFNTNSIKSPMAEGGIFVGIDTDTSSDRSSFAFANKTIITNWSELKWSENSEAPPPNHNWMIRVSNK